MQRPHFREYTKKEVARIALRPDYVLGIWVIKAMATQARLPSPRQTASGQDGQNFGVGRSDVRRWNPVAVIRTERNAWITTESKRPAAIGQCHPQRCGNEIPSSGPAANLFFHEFTSSSILSRNTGMDRPGSGF